MNFSAAFRFLLWGAFCVLFMSGCGQPRPDGLPNLYPVTLKFMQEGAPCTDALVSLTPESDGQWAVGGITDSNGNAALLTHGRYPGVPAGKYKVAVIKTETELIGPPPTGTEDAVGSTTYNLIDPVYSISSSTTLAIEVVAGKNSFPPFDLGKKVREIVASP